MRQASTRLISTGTFTGATRAARTVSALHPVPRGLFPLTLCVPSANLPTRVAAFPLFQRYCINHVNETLHEMGVLKGITTDPFSEIWMGQKTGALSDGRDAPSPEVHFQEQKPLRGKPSWPTTWPIEL